jgi:hypothetical protein
MGAPQPMGGPTPFTAVPPQPMGNMGMQAYSNNMAPMSQQMASDITAQATNTTKRVMLIVAIAVGASVLLGIVITVLAYMRSSS